MRIVRHQSTPATFQNTQVGMGITKDGNTLHYNRNFLFGERDVLLFTVDKYDPIKRLFDEISKADHHIITLKQTASTN